jgi:hypothetical protein
MYAFAVRACPVSISTFSTMSWICSIVGIVTSGLFSRKTVTTSASSSARKRSAPPTASAAL